LIGRSTAFKPFGLAPATRARAAKENIRRELYIFLSRKGGKKRMPLNLKPANKHLQQKAMGFGYCPLVGVFQHLPALPEKRRTSFFGQLVQRARFRRNRKPVNKSSTRAIKHKKEKIFTSVSVIGTKIATIFNDNI
jgi:hypothetical protein